MFGSDMAHVFLPVWRGGRLLFFTDIKEPNSGRISYRAAAATKKGSLDVVRTHKAPISQTEFERCQATADDGPALQRFFRILSGGNLELLAGVSSSQLPPCADGQSVLIYTCSYFNFLRKYSVDEQIIKNYESRLANERFSPEISLSIYKSLSAHLQPLRASALIDQDIPEISEVRGPSRILANLFREAAVVKFDAASYSQAEKFMRHAISLQESEDKWRRLADIHIASGNQNAAIESFFRADKISALAAPPSLRLAGLLIENQRHAEASPYLERAAASFPEAVKKYNARIAGSAKNP